MALFHFHVTQVKRSAGQSIVTSAAYRAGEKLYSEYYGEISDYTHKGDVVCTDILLPPQAPAEHQDRATLWNAVEKTERGKKAQLAYSFDIAWVCYHSEKMEITDQFDENGVCYVQISTNSGPLYLTIQRIVFDKIPMGKLTLLSYMQRAAEAIQK